MNKDLIAKTNQDITNTIYFLEQAITTLKALRDEIPMTSFIHMAKMRQVDKMVETLEEMK